MTTLADRTISALRIEHDLVAGLVATLSDEQLDAGSGAAEWTIAQVLSHLGSGAEIMLATLRGALGDADAPGEGFNESVWDRWNAKAPRAQADDFVTQDAELVAALEGLTAEQRESVEVELAFLPTPLPLAGFAAMRLNEAAMHGWDARAGVDDGASVPEASALVLLEQLSGTLGFLTGFIGKTEAAGEPFVLDLAGSGYGLAVSDTVNVVNPPGAVTANFAGPVEAAVRMIAGRLTPSHTPADVAVTGNVSLDSLRAVFPGF